MNAESASSFSCNLFPVLPRAVPNTIQYTNYVTELGAFIPRPGGGEIFSTRPDRAWGPPSLLYDAYQVIPGGKAAGAWR